MWKFAPIIFIWLVAGLIFLSLLEKLQLIDIHFFQWFSIMAAVLFSLCCFSSWFMFKKMSHSIQSGIQTWDQDLKLDIVPFLQQRKMRLLMLLGFLCVFFVIHFYLINTSKAQNHEIFLFVFVICLVHSSLVLTLVFLKLLKTHEWVKHENRLFDLEEK